MRLSLNLIVGYSLRCGISDFSFTTAAQRPLTPKGGEATVYPLSSALATAGFHKMSYLSHCFSVHLIVYFVKLNTLVTYDPIR